MTRKYLIPLFGVLIIAGAKWLIDTFIRRSRHTNVGSFVNAGIPDQVDTTEQAQMENAKMVSEGSQFGVQYFNESLAESEEELEERITN